MIHFELPLSTLLLKYFLMGFMLLDVLCFSFVHPNNTAVSAYFE